MKETLKKIGIFISIFIVFTALFMGGEYFTYRLLLIRSRLYVPYYIVLIGSGSTMIALLNKANFFPKILNICLVLASILLGLWLLSMLIKVI